jgi:uncharacterized membrane protein YhaH (DUF805 family)
LKEAFIAACRELIDFFEQLLQTTPTKKYTFEYEIEAGVMFQLFFNPLGRVSRTEFTLGWLFWFVLEIGFWCGFMASTQNTPAYSAWFLAAMTASSLSTVSILLLGMKRLRDAGLPAWPALILLAPIISLIALIVMSNLPSQANRLDLE